jgi:hypothetical protein
MLNLCRNDLALSVAIVVLGLGIVGTAVIAYVPDLEWEPIWVFLTAVFTAVLAWSTINLWSATKEIGERSERTLRTAERAYVKMSHAPPGLRPVPDQPRTYVIEVVISNYGRTPASVTDALIKNVVLGRGDQLPREPDYTPDPGVHVPPQAFLVTNDHISFYRRWSLPQDIERSLEHPDPVFEFYAIGYVDYTDAFGKRYRAGYARRYKPERNFWDQEVYPTPEKYHGRSNLMVVGGENYNYDLCLDEVNEE